MSKITDFLKKPRNIYFSLIIMLTIVTGLVSISFSYYVDDSTNNTKLVSLSKVDNIIQSDYLNDGLITIPANQTIEIDLYVISNNNFDSSYKLYYKTNADDFKVYSLNDLNDIIGGHDVHKVTLFIENYETSQVNVQIGIANGYINTDIDVDGNEITKK